MQLSIHSPRAVPWAAAVRFGDPHAALGLQSQPQPLWPLRKRSEGLYWGLRSVPAVLCYSPGLLSHWRVVGHLGHGTETSLWFWLTWLGQGGGSECWHALQARCTEAEARAGDKAAISPCCAPTVRPPEAVGPYASPPRSMQGSAQKRPSCTRGLPVPSAYALNEVTLGRASCTHTLSIAGIRPYDITPGPHVAMPSLQYMVFNPTAVVGFKGHKPTAAPAPHHLPASKPTRWEELQHTSFQGDGCQGPWRAVGIQQAVDEAPCWHLRPSENGDRSCSSLKELMAHLEVGETPRSKTIAPRQNYPSSKNRVRWIQEKPLKHRQYSSIEFQHSACTGLACPLLRTAHHKQALKPRCERWAVMKALVWRVKWPRCEEKGTPYGAESQGKLNRSGNCAPAAGDKTLAPGSVPGQESQRVVGAAIQMEHLHSRGIKRHNMIYTSMQIYHIIYMR